MTPVDWRESLALSRDEGAPFPVAWEIATTEHPLEDFMEGYFNEGRDSEGNDFAVWLRSVWEGAYESKAFSRGQKPTRLEPRNTYAEGVRSPHSGSQTPSHGINSQTWASTETDGGLSNPSAGTESPRGGVGIDTRVTPPKRCKSGDRCDRDGGHGLTGLFCEHHAGELARIRKVHGLDEAFDWDEFSSKTYQAAFG